MLIDAVSAFALDWAHSETRGVAGSGVKVLPLSLQTYVFRNCVKTKRAAMRDALIIAVVIACLVGPVRAQQGSAYPSPGSSRGEAFPKHVSPTGTPATNWVGQEHEYTDPNGPNSRRLYRSQHYHHRHRRHYHHR
jgi:hypothetical protein